MGRFHYAWIILVMGTLVVFGAPGLARFGTPLSCLPTGRTGWRFSAHSVRC